MEPSKLEIRIPRDADIGRLLGFFERTEYAAEQTDERTVALTAPRNADAELARREIRIYLRILERVHPGLGAAVVTESRAGL
jgi:hypothetical protein